MHDPVDALIRDFGTYLSYFEMEVAPNWPACTATPANYRPARGILWEIVAP